MYPTTSKARERVLQAAERLFSERGYTAVTLRDIAVALGMHQSSLYNHAPGGKEALFVAVTERGLQRHKQGIEQAIAEAQPHIRPRLRAVAHWLMSQPPLNLRRMRYSDMPEIAPAHAQQLTQMVYTSLFLPMNQVIEEAVQQGEIDAQRGAILSGMFIAAIESFRDLEPHTGIPEADMREQILDLLLDGARPR